MTELLYAYCIVDAGSPALDLLDRGAVQGVEPRTALSALRAGAIVAAVSAVPAQIFDEQPLNELTGDLTRLAPYALRHELAIRTLFACSDALIPLSFGSVYRSAESVLAMLETRADELGALLKRLHGQEEWEVKLFRRPVAQLAALARAAEPAVRTAGSGPGRAYLMARLQERRAAAEAVSQTATVAAEVAATLGQGVTDLRAEALDGRSGGELELVERFAVLVRRPEAGQFRERVAALEQRYAPSGFSLEISGPWAPYSFVGKDADGQ